MSAETIGLTIIALALGTSTLNIEGLVTPNQNDPQGAYALIAKLDGDNSISAFERDIAFLKNDCARVYIEKRDDYTKINAITCNVIPPDHFARGVTFRTNIYEKFSADKKEFGIAFPEVEKASEILANLPQREGETLTVSGKNLVATIVSQSKNEEILSADIKALAPDNSSQPQYKISRLGCATITDLALTTQKPFAGAEAQGFISRLLKQTQTFNAITLQMDEGSSIQTINADQVSEFGNPPKIGNRVSLYWKPRDNLILGRRSIISEPEKGSADCKQSEEISPILYKKIMASLKDAINQSLLTKKD